MTKLSDSQLIVLSAAAARDDGSAVVPGTMKAAAASKVGSSLITRKLMREIRTKPGMPVWYEDGDGRGFSLVITAAGRKAIGVEDEAKPSTVKAEIASTSAARASKTVGARERLAPVEASEHGKSFREGSKQALIVKLLSAKAGVTLQALEDATGWLPHTTRAALTGLRKKGFSISRDRQPGKNSIYRIDGQVAGPASA